MNMHVYQEYFSENICSYLRINKKYLYESIKTNESLVVFNITTSNPLLEVYEWVFKRVCQLIVLQSKAGGRNKREES